MHQTMHQTMQQTMQQPMRSTNKTVSRPGTSFVLLTLALAFGAVACTKPSTIPMSFTFDYVAGEISKDSHSYTYRATVKQAKVTYYGPTSPCQRGRCQHREVSFTLSVEQGARLAKVFEGLCVRFRQTSATGGTGNFVTLRLSGSLRGKHAAIDIGGMTNRMSQRAGPTLDIKARALVARAGELQRTLRDFALSQMPEAQ